MEDNTCKKCGGHAKPSKGLLNTLLSHSDFGGDAGLRGTTQTRNGPAELVDCLKCESCGHSWVPTELVELAVAETQRYSRSSFPEYKIRARIFLYVNDGVKDGDEAVINIYTTETDKEKFLLGIKSLSSDKVADCQIMSWNTKEQDEIESQFIDEVLRNISK